MLALIGLAGSAAFIGGGPLLVDKVQSLKAPVSYESGQFGDPGGGGGTLDEAQLGQFRGEAFPGALGQGRMTRGGRGGRIIPITTLADRGPGSLRSCIEAEGPRVCIFRVGGVIRFTSERPIIRNPFLTIAGQTAPGGGILITHGGGATGFTPLVIKNSHDLIVRHVRVRTDLNGDKPGSNGSFLYERSTDVIFDHVSGSWALDQIMSGYSDNDRISITNSIFAKGVPKHDKCALLASDPDPSKPQKLSFIGNLCAHNGDRNPDVNFPPRSCVELVNNVFYNANSQFTEVHELFGGTPVNIVANVYKAGPDTRVGRAAVDRVLIGSTGKSRIYMSGNALDGTDELATAPALSAASPAPVCPLTLAPLAARQAYERVLSSSGAFPRDSFDRKTVGEVRNGGGSIMKGEGRIGPRRLPEIAGGEPYADNDRDGMADSWERANGTDPRRSDPWQDANSNGWTNMDEFLDFAHRSVMAGRTIR